MCEGVSLLSAGNSPPDPHIPARAYPSLGRSTAQLVNGIPRVSLPPGLLYHFVGDSYVPSFARKQTRLTHSHGHGAFADLATVSV